MANHIKQTNNNVTRLINLMFYLKEHKRGVTAAQIREQVPGYSNTQKENLSTKINKREKLYIFYFPFLIFQF